MKTLILSGYGTNCEKETVYACQQAGGGPGVTLRHMSDLYAEGIDLSQYHFLVFMGGFLDGDDLGSGRACANRFRYRPLPQGGTFLQALERFVASGRLVLGICNGFQLLVKLGLLPWEDDGVRQRVTLAPNANNRFEDRWVRLTVDNASPCVFTRGMSWLDLPVRHGEGRLVGPEADSIATLARRGLVPLRYSTAEGQHTEAYPHNPNGSPLGAAALCSPSGTVMGLMPHPEAYNHFTNHPQWSRQPFTQEEGQGIALFRNGYEHLKAQNL